MTKAKSGRVSDNQTDQTGGVGANIERSAFGWEMEPGKGVGRALRAQARRPKNLFLRARVLEVVAECTGTLRLGELLIPRDRLILVIKETLVSSPRPIIRSSRFAFLLPLRVVLGFESAALYPPATRSGSRRLSGFLNPVLLVEVARVPRREEEKNGMFVWVIKGWNVEGD
jgi:hypothetical protein